MTGNSLDIFTAKGNKLDVTQDELTLAKQIWSEGLRSVENYAQLKQQLPFQHLAIQIAGDLERSDLLYTGTALAFDTYHQDQHVSPINYHALIQANQTLFKIIRDWSYFLPQITNFSYRPKLRQSKLGGETYKLDQKTNTIIAYQGKRRQKLYYDKTKKQSATLLSKKLHTQGFCWGTGLLFDEAQCDIKARYKVNAATFYRGWVGNYASVQQFQDRVHPFLMTDPEAFKQYVDQPDARGHNEVLAKFSLASILGVFIWPDSPAGRSEARQRQQDLKRAFKRDYPLFIYDNINHTMRLYTKQEQIDDGLGYPQLARDAALQTDSLVTAVSQGNLPTIIQLLTDDPSRVNKRFDEGSLLIIASRAGHTEVVAYLLEQEADIGYCDRNRETALMHAVRQGHIDVIKVLLEKHDDLKLKNRNGETVFDIAIKTHPKVLEPLLLHAVNLDQDKGRLLTKRSKKQVKKIFASLIEQEHMVGLMVFFLLEIDDMIQSFNPGKPSHKKAIEAATALHATLKDSLMTYYDSAKEQTDRDTLFNAWGGAVMDAEKSELINHRGHAKNIFYNLSLFVFTLGLGYLHNLYKSGGNQLFFKTNTRSFNALKDLECKLYTIVNASH